MREEYDVKPVSVIAVSNNIRRSMGKRKITIPRGTAIASLSLRSSVSASARAWPTVTEMSWAWFEYRIHTNIATQLLVQAH